MPGGLLQIASSGIQDIYLTRNPEITFFKKIYRRHTNFSLETKEINMEQFPNYGDEFFINLPKFGDLVYRAYFKIELPLLNYDDSYILNPEYKILKDNMIKNLNEEISLWNTEYNTLSKFSEIQIIFYQKILILLKSQDVTYQNINNETLTLRNSYNELLRTTVFRIDEDIIDKIDIINYIINFKRKFGDTNDEANNIITYETFLNNITIIYKNIIKQLKYYFSNYIYYKNKLEKLIAGNIDYAWIENIGNHYFTNYNIEIDGQLIEQYTSDYLNMYNSHHFKDNEKKNLNEMIGNVKQINNFQTKKESYEIIIPLIFWFNRSSNNALPLVSMKHSQVVLNVKINEISKLIYFNHYKNEYDDILKLDMHVKQHLKNKDKIKSLWFVNVNVNEDDIEKIDILERERIYIYHFKYITKELLKIKFKNLNNTQIDTLFTKYSSDGLKITYNDWIKFRVNSFTETNTDIINVSKNIFLFNSPSFQDLNTLVGRIPRPKIKFFAEYIYLDEVERFKFASNDLEYVINIPNQITTDIGNTEYFSTDIDILKPTKDIFWALIPKVNKNGLTKYSYKNPSILNKCFYIDEKVLKDLKLSVQDINIIDFKLGENYYIYTTKHKNLNASYDNSFYMSFSLFPENDQPSGNVNFSMIKGKQLQVHIRKEFISEYYKNDININSQNIELIFINRSYNLLKFEKGKGVLTFY